MNACFKNCIVSLAKQTPEIIQILVDKNLEIITVKHKNTFIQLSIQEFLSNFCNVITDEKVNIELSLLAKKKIRIYTHIIARLRIYYKKFMSKIKLIIIVEMQ